MEADGSPNRPALRSSTSERCPTDSVNQFQRPHSLSPKSPRSHWFDSSPQMKFNSNEPLINYQPTSNGHPSNEMVDAPARDLVMLLRSQIAQLLEQQDVILTELDEHKEQILLMKREQNESEVDPSSDMLLLQTELADARLREAELTVTFEELQHRIEEIDRLIETDPDLHAFFNEVTISSTELSRQKAHSTVTNSTTSSPAKSSIHGREGSSSTRRQATGSTNRRRSSSRQQTHSSRSHGNSRARPQTPIKSSTLVAEQTQDAASLSGFDSPLSDSGCSMASHSNSDSRGDKTDISITSEDGDSTKSNFKSSPPIRSTAPPQKSNTQRPQRPTYLYPTVDETSFDLPIDRSHVYLSMLRRSRSNAAEHQSFAQLCSEASTPSARDDFDSLGNYRFLRPAGDAQTPTESRAISDCVRPANSQQQVGVSDTFSRIRASFRQSFSWMSGRPDFRMEALAARQGEARALLALRETRIEVLKLQSRCQTLQRHITKQESICASKEAEIECATARERSLRQEIRNLQRRIFQLEAEHRELEVAQRIHEMELMSKLAESNLRLSHAEMTQQQAAVWSQLTQAHNAAACLLTPANSHISLAVPSISGGSASSNLSMPQSASPSFSFPPHDTAAQSNLTDIDHRRRTGSETAEGHSQHESRPDLAKKITKLSEKSTAGGRQRNSHGGSYQCLLNGNSDSASRADETQNQFNSGSSNRLSHQTMDQSIGSLSELRLVADFVVRDDQSCENL